MKRFLLVLALVAVAGAMYVATAPGSQTAGPTAKQFKTLKKQVAALQKQVKAANANTNGLGDFVLACIVHASVGVDPVGDSSDGYLFGAPGTPPASASATSALTGDASGTPTYRFYAVNQDIPACVQIADNAAPRHAMKLLSRLAKR